MHRQSFDPRVCPVCNQEFPPRGPTQKYCSRACQLRAAQDARRNNAMGERPCENCGTVFRPRQTGNAGRFCSRECLYESMRGDRAANWKGGRYVKPDGYAKVYRPDHPARDGMGYVLEHRLVMEQKLGRPLLPSENVHHRNGIRDDNQPENLELWIKKQPQGQRAEDIVAYAREILGLYGSNAERRRYAKDRQARIEKALSSD